MKEFEMIFRDDVFFRGRVSTNTCAIGKERTKAVTNPIKQ